MGCRCFWAAVRFYENVMSLWFMLVLENRSVCFIIHTIYIFKCNFFRLFGMTLSFRNLSETSFFRMSHAVIHKTLPVKSLTDWAAGIRFRYFLYKINICGISWPRPRPPFCWPPREPCLFLFAYFGRLSLRQLSCVELHPTSKGEYRPALHNQAERRRAKSSAEKLQQEHIAFDNLSPPLVAELLTSEPKRENDGTLSLVMESGSDYGHVFILFCFTWSERPSW